MDRIYSNIPRIKQKERISTVIGRQFKTNQDQNLLVIVADSSEVRAKTTNLILNLPTLNSDAFLLEQSAIPAEMFCILKFRCRSSNKSTSKVTLWVSKMSRRAVPEAFFA